MRHEKKMVRGASCAVAACVLAACGPGDSTPPQPPTANSQHVATPEDASVSGMVTGIAAHGNPLSFVVWNQPEHGEVTLNSFTGEFTYTPRPNFNGTDHFTFESVEKGQRSYQAPVTIDVQSVNDPIALAAIPDMMNSAETFATVYALAVDDVDDDAHSVVVASDNPDVAMVSSSGLDRTISISPGARGKARVHVMVSDGSYLAERDFEFTVGDVTKTREFAADMSAGETITLQNTIDQPITLTLEHNGFPMFQSDEEMARFVADMKAEYAGEPFERKLWRFMRDNVYHNVPLNADQWLNDPWAVVSSQGWGLCSHVSAAFVRLAKASGYEARIWGLTGHVVPEIKVGNDWQMFDPDLAVYYFDHDSKLAGVTQLAEDPGLIAAPVNAVFAASDYNWPYSTVVADIYGSTDDNYIADAVFLPKSAAKYQPLVLPAGARFTYPGRWTPTVLGMDGDTPREVPYYLQGNLVLPAGATGNVVMPWMIWEIRGEGRVRVLDHDYDIGSPELATVLQRPGKQIADIELLSSSTDVQFIFFINAMRYGLDARNSVLIHGKDVWAVSVEKRNLRIDFQAQTSGYEFEKPRF
jgi:hypothetical protein